MLTCVIDVLLIILVDIIEFPCRPYLSDELEQLISTGRSLEQQLKQTLDITAWQEDQLEEIDKQVRFIDYPFLVCLWSS